MRRSLEVSRESAKLPHLKMKRLLWARLFGNCLIILFIEFRGSYFSFPDNDGAVKVPREQIPKEVPKHCLSVPRCTPLNHHHHHYVLTFLFPSNLSHAQILTEQERKKRAIRSHEHTHLNSPRFRRRKGLRPTVKCRHDY